MSLPSLSPVRIASEALLFAGAVLLAGYLLRPRGRVAVSPCPPDEDPCFDDAGIPLRLAGHGMARVA